MADRTIPDDARREINRRLDAIEADSGAIVVFACESGSRAWGFASPDSDFDVRFIYLRPRTWYLSVDLEEKRDVIETPIEDVWDVNGWDLRKALRLFRKSNPPLLEWLQSPIVYRERSSVPRRMRELLRTYYSPPACMYHYLHMAQGNFRSYLQEDQVWLKKYFYVLRPLLGCRWIEFDKGPVPMEFERLVEASELDRDVAEAIQGLLIDKRDGAELKRGPRIPPLNHFIESEFARYEASGLTRKKPRTDVEPLSELFQLALDEIWNREGGAQQGAAADTS